MVKKYLSLMMSYAACVSCVQIAPALHVEYQFLIADATEYCFDHSSHSRKNVLPIRRNFLLVIFKSIIWMWSNFHVNKFMFYEYFFYILTNFDIFVILILNVMNILDSKNILSQIIAKIISISFNQNINILSSFSQNQ